MSEDPASETYVSMKQDDCEEVGIEASDIDIDSDADAAELYDTIEDLNADEDVNGIWSRCRSPTTRGQVGPARHRPDERRRRLPSGKRRSARSR